MSAVSWDRLRAWIDEQVAWEQEHNLPAPLTSAQLTAISKLVPLAPPEPEKELDDFNYVGKLLEYSQVKHLAPPTYKDEQVNLVFAGAAQIKWRCRCELPWEDKVFPRADHGYKASEQPPSFQSKKKAKQFAAKHALDYLKLPPTPTQLTTPQVSQAQPTISQTPPAPKRVKVEVATPSSLSSSDEGPTLFERVSALAGSLNFDCPQYRFEPEDTPNFWSGRPVFKTGARIPDDLGVVSGIYGKKAAKTAMAEKVLEWLLAQDKERQEMTTRLLGGLSSMPRDQ
ncbi:hypothetical protein G7046_g319 [Stylonectria norvegica]|nr:hypothetical protein G7046_g319 [Stylonectria norvegica]